MIERLELKNLTVFNCLTLELSPKINVIIEQYKKQFGANSVRRLSTRD